MAEMTIRRFSVFSIAKMQAFLGFVIGLIIGVIYGLFVIIFGAAIITLAPESERQALGGVSTVVAGIAIIIIVPLIYTVFGFIGGAIGGLVYNIAAGMVGGIRFELEGPGPAYMPPPGANPYAAR